MHQNGDAHEADTRAFTHQDEPSDEDTAELPVLAVDAAEAGDVTDVVPTLQPPEEIIDTSGEARASSWVNSMEAEIQWLQERWRTLDRELRRSEERAQKLGTESAEKDAAIADLETEISRQVRSIEKLNASMLDRETALSSLEAEKESLEKQLAERSEALNEARGQAAILEDRLHAVLKERDELGSKLADEKTRLFELSARNDGVEETKQRLATKVQDLETYIEGRRDKWSSLNNELELRESRIGELEAAVAASEQRVADREAQIESLRETILELERLRSEAEGRHKEREASNREIQALLAEQAAEIGSLRAAANDGKSGASLAGEAAERYRLEIEALRQQLDEKGRAIDEKEQSLKALETELASTKALNRHMEGQSADERRRAGELERELAAQGVERERLAQALAAAKDEIAALGLRLADTKANADSLREENAGHEAKIAELEADLSRRSEVIRAFDRHAKRLSALKQNLHSLSADEKGTGPIDGASTEVAAAGPDDDRADVAKNGAIDEPQPLERMIIPLDAEPSDGAEYSLSKPVVTIGRAKTSDIRIVDAVVSRMHARLTTDNDVTVIEDLGSKNGVLVNSRPVGRAVLQHGDVISLGANHDFRYVEIRPATH